MSSMHWTLDKCNVIFLKNGSRLQYKEKVLQEHNRVIFSYGIANERLKNRAVNPLILHFSEI